MGNISPHVLHNNSIRKNRQVNSICTNTCDGNRDEGSMMDIEWSSEREREGRWSQS